MARNPYFYIVAGELTPTLDVALFDGDGRLVNLQGAEVEFTLYSLRGTIRFSSPASVVSEEGIVRHAWSSGQTDTPGRYLGRFRVTYSNLDEQDFPSNRYIEIEMT